MGRKEFDFPQGLQPNVYGARSDTAEQAAGKVLKDARLAD